MMLEQGYGEGDPKMRLAQLREALLRDCRYVTGIMLHTQGWTVEQGQKLFVEKGFQQPANAYEEARRGAYNPTYLYYTLGKLMIYKLRADYQQAKGAAYTLQGFHDEFVKQGPLPLKLMRRVHAAGAIQRRCCNSAGQDVAVNRPVVAGAAAEHEDVPDGVRVPARRGVKNDAGRVGHPAGQEPEESIPGQPAQ